MGEQGLQLLSSPPRFQLKSRWPDRTWKHSSLRTTLGVLQKAEKKTKCHSSRGQQTCVSPGCNWIVCRVSATSPLSSRSCDLLGEEMSVGSRAAVGACGHGGRPPRSVAQRCGRAGHYLWTYPWKGHENTLMLGDTKRYRRGAGRANRAMIRPQER